MTTTLGSKIKSCRKRKGFTLEGLAKEIGTGKSYVWELENRGVQPTAERLKKIAESLGVTADFLLDQESEEPSQSEYEKVFFRKYQKLDKRKQEKLDKILDTLWDDDE